MLSELHLNRLADVLIWGMKAARNRPFGAGEVVLIQYDRAGLRLAEVLYEKVIDLGLNPVQRAGLSVAMERAFYGRTKKRQLVFIPPGERELCEGLAGRIFIHAPESLTHLRDMDPTRIGRAAVARKVLRDILERREREGLYGWTLCTLPTAELAARAGLSPPDYARQMIRACYLDRKEPVAAWEEIRREASQIKRWLDSLEILELRLESASFDLKITPGLRRRWLGVSGHNIPSFELFTSPDWRGTEGTFYADLPSYRSGNYVQGIRLFFAKGAVTALEARKGEAFAAGQIRMDRGASRLGELSLTDRRFSRIDRFMADTLFDENFGGKSGNCHIALGASYSDTYAGDPAELDAGRKKALGFNDSALHWDLVNTEEKTVTARLRGGKRLVIYEKGQFRC